MLMTMGVTRHGRWNDVKEGVCRAARALAECLQNVMQVVLSQEKMTTFASSPKLLQEICQELGHLAGKPDMAPVYLGVDAGMARQRGKPGGGKTRAARLRAAKLRAAKLKRWARTIKQSTGRLRCIYMAGIRPAAGYGSAVNG